MNSWQSQAGCIVRAGAMMLDEFSGLDGLGWLPEGVSGPWAEGFLVCEDELERQLTVLSAGSFEWRVG